MQNYIKVLCKYLFMKDSEYKDDPVISKQLSKSRNWIHVLVLVAGLMYIILQIGIFATSGNIELINLGIGILLVMSGLGNILKNHNTVFLLWLIGGIVIIAIELIITAKISLLVTGIGMLAIFYSIMYRRKYKN